MDDGTDEPAAGGQPLPPADRPWQHPSEAGRAQLDHSDRRRGLRLSALLVLAGFGLLVVGIAIGRSDRGQTETAGPSDRIGPTVATIAFDDGGQTQMATGVAVDRRGHVLVRASLIGGATRLRAACAGHDPVSARVVAVDAVDDVALVRMSGTSCRTAPTAASPKVGSRIMAVRADEDGTRLMWRNGNVRSTGVDLMREDGVVAEVFQTDATGIEHRGDGVVFNSDGHFVGIVAAGPDDGKVAVLAGSALLQTAVDLARGRTVVHPWIGITGHDLEPGEAAADLTHGAMVSAVTVGGPADAAGLMPGDAVVALNGQAVESMAQVARTVHRHQVGDQLVVQVDRAGSDLVLTVTVGSQPTG